MSTDRVRLGDLGENTAGRFLQELGYQILTNNYRCSRGEVDIVAKDGGEMVFVEVRTRRGDGFGTPQESLTRAKVRRLVATCQDYLQLHDKAVANWRIDLVCDRLDGSRRLEGIDHIKHAVQL